MGISDADPTGSATPTQDSESVAALKARIAELEAGSSASAPEVPLPPGTVEPGTDPSTVVDTPADAPATTVDEQSPQVSALQEQLKAKQAEIDQLTSQALAQNDPATADSSVDVKGLLNQLVQAQQEYRSEITQLRTELAKVRRQPIPTSTVRALSAEELQALRMADIENASHYCPGCGALYQRPRECTGDPASPHPAIEVVETKELLNPPDPSNKAKVEEYQQGHTEMQYVNPHVQAALLG